MSQSPAPDRLSPTSPDLAQERLARLHALLPGAFAEGKLVPERLAELVGAKAISSTPERYGLSYAGRAEALREMLAPSHGTLRPDREKSVAWDATGNLIIEGDNLHVLKLLQSAYAGAVKLIYIDPPYNTGNDFVYPDDFRAGVKHYRELTQQSLSTNAETSGRYHSDWLKMMHPRLALARNLLRDDGVIFVSIDDHEVHNLRLLMDEVFGEENFLVELVFDKNRKNDAKLFSVGHEYMMGYAWSKAHLRDTGVVFRSEKQGVEEIREVFNRLRSLHGDEWEKIQQGLKAHYLTWPKDDPREPLARFTKVDSAGPYRDDKDISWPGGGGPKYEVLHPKTGRPCKVPSRGWVFSTPEKMAEKIRDGVVVFGANETTVPSLRTNLFERTEQVMRSVIFSYAQTATQEFAKLFDGERVFENPKAVSDIKGIIEYVAGPSDLVLDFFAGSGTTGQAVLELNRQDGGNRKFILVQFPEPTGRADFPTIADITRERVRRAIARRPADLASGAPEGFRAYRLDDSNFKLWDADAVPADAAALAKQLELIAHNVLDDRGDEDVLAELLLKCGHPGVTLTSAVETREVAGAPVHLLAEGRLAICLARTLTQDVLRGIVALKPQRVLCLDVGFHGNDQLKTNTVLEMKSHGVQFQTV